METIEELKNLQKKIIRKNKKYQIILWSIIIPLAALTILIMNTTGKNLLEIIMAVMSELFFGTIIFLFVHNKLLGEDIKQFQRGYKDIFILSSLRNTFDEVNFNPSAGLSAAMLSNTGMLSSSNRLSSNDYVSAKYKGLPFEQSDVHIEEKYETVDEDGYVREYWKTVFRGRWMIFDFNKKFLTDIRVFNYLFRKNGLKVKNKYPQVQLEDTEFNDIFSVYSNNEFDVYYALPPDIMERMKEISKTLNCGLMFVFVDQKLHIAINNGQDSFEHSPFEKIDESKIRDNVSKDIRLITELVEQLKLNRGLFSQNQSL